MGDGLLEALLLRFMQVSWGHTTPRVPFALGGLFLPANRKGELPDKLSHCEGGAPRETSECFGGGGPIPPERRRGLGRPLGAAEGKQEPKTTFAVEVDGLANGYRPGHLANGAKCRPSTKHGTVETYKTLPQTERSGAKCK